MTAAKGFTLIELMVTLAIMAVVISLATPSFLTFQVNSQIATITSDFQADLAVARSRSVLSNRAFILCGSADGATCSGSWEQGWVVGPDSNTDDQIDAGEPVASTHAALPNGFTLVSSNAGGFVRFAPSGAVSAVQTFTICRTQFRGRTIALTAIGRPVVTLMTNNCP